MTTTLLSLALSLLIAAQQPNVDAALKAKAVTVANQAIEVALRDASSSSPLIAVLDEDKPKIDVFADLMRSLDPLTMSPEEYEDAAKDALELAGGIWWKDETYAVKEIRRLVREKFDDFTNYAGNFKEPYHNATDNTRIRMILKEIEKKVNNEIEDLEVPADLFPQGIVGCLKSNPSIALYRRDTAHGYVATTGTQPSAGSLYYLEPVTGGEGYGYMTRAIVIKQEQLQTANCSLRFMGETGGR